MKKFLATMATIILLPSAANASDAMALTLDEAIGIALKNNRQIEQFKEEREAARWQLSAVRRSSGLNLAWTSTFNKIGGRYYRRSFRTPRDNAKLQNIINYYRGDPLLNIRLFPNYNYENANTVVLRYPLYTGGRLENQREAASYALNAADLALENSRQTVKYQAAAAYYRVLQQQSAVEVQKEAVSLLEEHLRNVSIQYEVGTVAKSDMLSTRVQLANSQQSLNSARGNYQTAIAQLNNIMGVPVDTEIATSGDHGFVKYGLTEEQCLEYALEHRPDGIAAAYRVKQAKAQVSAAKSNYRPSINAMMRGDMTGESLFKGNHGGERWSAGFELSWNIFDNGVTSAQVHQQQAAERRAESAAKQQLETIELEVRNSYIALKTAEENIATTASAVAMAEEGFSIAQVRYVEGVDTNLNVMNAQEKVVETRNNYYAALYAYNTARAQLEKAMGVPVTIDAKIYDEAVEQGKSSPKSLEAATVEQKNYFDADAWEIPLPFETANR